MKKRELEDRIEESHPSEESKEKLLEEVLSISTEKKIKMHEAYLLYFFLEDIGNISEENSILKLREFFLLLLANCSEVNSDAGIKELEEITSNFLTAALSEISEYAKKAEETKENKWKKIFGVFFDSRDFIKKYDGVFNLKIHEFIKKILLGSLSGDTTPDEKNTDSFRLFYSKTLDEFNYV